MLYYVCNEKSKDYYIENTSNTFHIYGKNNLKHDNKELFLLTNYTYNEKGHIIKSITNIQQDGSKWSKTYYDVDSNGNKTHSRTYAYINTISDYSLSYEESYSYKNGKILNYKRFKNEYEYNEITDEYEYEYKNDIVKITNVHDRKIEYFKTFYIENKTLHCLIDENEKPIFKRANYHYPL